MPYTTQQGDKRATRQNHHKTTELHDKIRNERQDHYKTRQNKTCVQALTNRQTNKSGANRWHIKPFTRFHLSFLRDETRQDDARHEARGTNARHKTQDTRRDETRRDKTRQDKTRQDKTRQEKDKGRGDKLNKDHEMRKTKQIKFMCSKTPNLFGYFWPIRRVSKRLKVGSCNGKIRCERL